MKQSEKIPYHSINFNIVVKSPEKFEYLKKLDVLYLEPYDVVNTNSPNVIVKSEEGSLKERSVEIHKDQMKPYVLRWASSMYKIY